MCVHAESVIITLAFFASVDSITRKRIDDGGPMIVMNKPCSLFYLSLTETPLICWFKKIPSIEETRILYLFSICFHFWVLFFFVGSWQYRESTEHATKVIPKSQMQVCASMFSSGRWWCSALRGPQETTNRRHIYKSAQRSIYCGQHFFQRGGYYCERVNLPEGQCVKTEDILQI